MRFLTSCFTLALLSSTAGAHAFCDDILATQALCVTEEAEEIKLCATQHPETGAEAFELHVTPQISDGPLIQLALDTPFSMTPGTGGYPWDSYSLTFLHEGGRAVLTIQTPIDGGGGADEAEIWLDLYDRGVAPTRRLSCLTPALSAEVAEILAAREVAFNSFRTGPSGESAAYYQPRMPLVGAVPYGGAECREVSGVLSNEGTANGQIALYAAPFEEAAILGYVSPYALKGAFECDFDNGFSGIIWTDPEKGDGAGGYMSALDYDAKLEACDLTPEGWPADVAYLGKCSSAWVHEGNVAGFEP